jgi:O-antigen/teichoic acid export membrane protein
LTQYKWFRQNARASQTALAKSPGNYRGRAFWSAIDAGSAPLSSLLIAGGLVRSLGTEEYGLIVVALAISGLSTAVNPAIATTTTKFVSEASGLERDHQAIGRIITTSLVAVTAINIVLIGMSIAFGKPLSTLLFGARITNSRFDIASVLMLAVTSVCLQQVDSVFSAALRGLERFRRQAIMEVGARVVLIGAVLTSAWSTHDTRSVLAVYCGVCAAAAVARSFALMSVLGARGLYVRPTSATFRGLLRYGSWMWLNAIATIAYGTVDRILVGRVAGASAAAEFSIYLQLAQLVHFVPASLFGFSLPVFSRLSANMARNSEELKHLYSRYLLGAGGFGLSIALCITVGIHPLLKMVGGNAFPYEHIASLILLVFGFFMLSVNIIPYYLTLGMGKSRDVSLVTGASMFASMLLTFLLTPTLEVTGAAIARLAYGIGAMALLLLAHRALKHK